jgi:hypothetical protein
MPATSAGMTVEAVVPAAPDGTTLLFGSSSSFAVNPAVMKNLRFDIQKDLKLVGLISDAPHVLVVRASLPVNTLGGLFALARQPPGKLTDASSDAGGAIHLASELFKREAGVDLVHVPYRGGGPAVIGLLSGDVDVFISDLSTTVETSAAGVSRRWRWHGRRVRRSCRRRRPSPSLVIPPSSHRRGLGSPRRPARRPTSSIGWRRRCSRSLRRRPTRPVSKISATSRFR